MATGAYVGGSGNKSQKVINIYIGDRSNHAAKVIKAYVGDANNKARLWWDGNGSIIFENGIFSNVPAGFDINVYVDDTDNVNNLAQYFNTNMLLWVHEQDVTTPWTVSNLLIDSNYNDTENQFIKNSIYIPVNRISNPRTLEITAKGSLVVNVGYVNGNILQTLLEKDIYGTTFQKYNIDVRNIPYIDYIKISSSDCGVATHEENQYTSLIHQPVYFAKNHIEWREDSNTTIVIDVIQGWAYIVIGKFTNNLVEFILCSDEQFRADEIHYVNGQVDRTHRLVGSECTYGDVTYYLQNGYSRKHATENSSGSIEYTYFTSYGTPDSINEKYQIGYILSDGVTNRISGASFGQMSARITNTNVPAGEYWQNYADGWASNFPQPIPLYPPEDTLFTWTASYEVSYYGQTETVTYQNGLGLKSLVGNGDIYIFFIYDDIDSYHDNNAMYIVAISDQPFSAVELAQEWDSAYDATMWFDELDPEKHEIDENDYQASRITFFNYSYYVYTDWTHANENEGDIREHIDRNCIIMSDIPEYLTNYEPRVFWTAGYIIFHGIINGGSLQQVSKIKVLGGS